MAAHSTVRALYSGYAGMLYQVKRDSDNATKDIPVLAGSGVADSSVQDQFCGVSACVIWRIYDQSPRGNHLHVAPAGTHPPADKPVVATRQRLTVSGHAVYGAVFLGGEGYRNDATSGVAVGDEAQSMYMVVDGTHYNDRCCFDCMSDACFAQLPLHISYSHLGSSLQASHRAARLAWQTATPRQTIRPTDRVPWRQCISAVREEASTTAE